MIQYRHFHYPFLTDCPSVTVAFDPETKCAGVAVCSLHDRFSRKNGRKIAEHRLNYAALCDQGEDTVNIAVPSFKYRNRAKDLAIVDIAIQAINGYDQHINVFRVSVPHSVYQVEKIPYQGTDESQTDAAVAS